MKFTASLVFAGLLAMGAYAQASADDDCCKLTSDDILALIDRIDTIEGEIDDNAQAIQDNTDLANSTNAGELALINANAAAIVINDGLIATNDSNIAANSAAISTNHDNIAANTLAIQANDASLLVNQGLINTNIADIAANGVRIAANTVLIDANAALITINTNADAAQATPIMDNASDISDNAAAIDVNEAAITANTDLLNMKTAANKALIDALTTELNDFKALMTFVTEEYFFTNSNVLEIYSAQPEIQPYTFCVQDGQNVEVITQVGVAAGKDDAPYELRVVDSSGNVLGTSTAEYKLNLKEQLTLSWKGTINLPEGTDSDELSVSLLKIYSNGQKQRQADAD